jgi:hypothetical protein
MFPKSCPYHVTITLLTLIFLRPYGEVMTNLNDNPDRIIGQALKSKTMEKDYDENGTDLSHQEAAPP